jgi:hypothetical protein
VSTLLNRTQLGPPGTAFPANAVYVGRRNPDMPCLQASELTLTASSATAIVEIDEPLFFGGEPARRDQINFDTTATRAEWGAVVVCESDRDELRVRVLVRQPKNLPEGQASCGGGEKEVLRQGDRSRFCDLEAGLSRQRCSRRTCFAFACAASFVARAKSLYTRIS